MSGKNFAVVRPQHVQDRISAITTLLKEMIVERHRAYASAAELIKHNYSKGLPRSGRPKLMLTVEELVEHEAAKRIRRQTQRELKVLVPLLRRVVTGTQQKDTFDPVTSPTVSALNLVLSPLVYGSGKNVEFEKPLASLFWARFPTMFAKVQAHEPRLAEPRKGVGQAKLELFNKITSAELLSTSEIAVLRGVFWEQ